MLAATRMSESRASRRRVSRRRRLARRRHRPGKGSGTPRPWRGARRQSFGGDRLGKRPISGRRADRGSTRYEEIRGAREDSATSRRSVSQRCCRLFRREFRPKTGSRIRRPGRGGRGQYAHTPAHTSAGVVSDGDLPTHRPMSRRPTGLRVALRCFGQSGNRILRFRRPEVARKDRDIWILGFTLLRAAGRSTTLPRRFVRHFHRFFGRRFRLKTGSGTRGLKLGVRGRCLGGDLLSGLRRRLLRRKVSGGPDFGSPAPTLMGGRATFRRHISRYRCRPLQMRFQLISGPGMRESGGSG